MPDETPLALFRAACTPERLDALQLAAFRQGSPALAALYRDLTAALEAEAPPSVADLMRECAELAQRVARNELGTPIEITYYAEESDREGGVICCAIFEATCLPLLCLPDCYADTPEAALLLLRDALRAELKEGE